MLVRRVWGKPTAGKVTVDVYTHYNTDRNQRMRKIIPLGSDEALVTFDLAGGRRKEALEEQQVVNAVKRQEAVRRDVLAQQLALAASGGTGSGGSPARIPIRRNNGNGGAPRGGAVGYQPVIERAAGRGEPFRAGRDLGRSPLRAHHVHSVFLGDLGSQHV